MVVMASAALTIPNLGFIVPDMGIRPLPKRRATSLPTSVANALFPKGRQRVLAVLYGNVDRSFYANEIIRLAGTGTGAVQRELESLAAAGLVTVTRVGNQKHFRANARAAVYDALHDLVLKTSGVADVLRAALADVAMDIRAAFVYGSVAKREDRSASDVDLMVISDSLAYAEVYAALETAARRLGRAVSPTLYSQSEFARRAKARNAFISRVLSQPKIWIIGGDDDLAA